MVVVKPFRVARLWAVSKGWHFQQLLPRGQDEYRTVSRRIRGRD